MSRKTPWVQPVGSFVEPVVAPTTDPDTGPFVNLLVAKDWLPFVLGALTQLQLTSTWLGSDADKLLAVDRATLLMNSIAGPSAASPGIPDTPIPLVRFYATTSTVQTSFDNGATWVDTPGSDPRNSVTYPPPTGSNIQCDAAASVVRRIQDVLAEAANAVNVGTGAGGIALGIVTALADLGPYGLLIDLFVLFAISLIALGFGAITGALTSAVYDQFECILFCAVSSNGQFTAAAFNQIYTDVGTDIGGTAGTLLQGILSLMGYGGLCQAAALKLDTDTCGGCGCTWCYDIDLTVPQTIVTDYPGQANFVNGAGFQRDALTTGRSLIITLPVAAYISTVEEYRTVAMTGTEHGMRVYDYDTTLNLLGTPTAANTHTSFTVGATHSRLAISDTTTPGGGGPAVPGFSTRIKLTGTGSNPFGTDNC